MADKKTTKPTNKKVIDLDETIIAQMQDHAEQIKSDDSARDQMFDDIDEMYLMTWDGGSGKKWSGVDLRISPDARNAALGAVRLLVATDPIFNVVNTSDKKKDQDKIERIEKAVTRMFECAGRAATNPIHYDALLSAVLYSEMHMAITSTASLVQAAKENGLGIERAERMELITPFIIDVWNPKDGHAEFDRLGLSAYYREADTTIGKLRSDFGALLPETTLQKKETDTVVLKTFYNNENALIWTDDGTIVARPHGLPFIPVMVQYTEGSSLWNLHEESRQPLLYTLLKSGFWEMQNMINTVMYSLIRDMGTTPMYKHKEPSGQEGKPLNIDFDRVPAIVHVSGDEDFIPITNKGLIDPSIQEGLALATQKVQESTLYPQALGAPVQGDSTFSELALLSQSGRLPLASTQRRGGWGFGQLMEMCLAIMKNDGVGAKAEGIDLKPNEIPNYVQIDAKLEVKLPQDKLQQANIAQIITGGENPLVSNEWARSNILQIGQSGDMDRQIWTERAAGLMFQQFMEQQIQQSQMAMQQQMMGAQPGQPGIEQGMPNGQPPMPPEMQAGPMMPQGQGQMVQGGLPPQMAGMVPGAGEGAVPPEGTM